jgi:MFS family permease
VATAQALAFTPNASLYLAYNLIASIGSGIWSVLFALYVFVYTGDIAFVGIVLAVEWAAHGMMALPAGMLADRFGRRFAFIAATSSAVILSSLQVTLLEPRWIILVLSALVGAGRAFHGVAGAPFLMENSGPAERMHLFAIASAVGSAAAFVGALGAGLLPGYLLQPTPLESYRLALILSIPISLAALAPIAMMREPRPEGVRRLFENVVSPLLITKLVMATALFAFAAGFSYAFFPIFYDHHHGSSIEQIGLFMGLASLAAVGAILISPVASKRLGKVKATVALSLLSVPFLLVMAFSGSIALVVGAMVARAVVINSAYPIRSVFSMEIVKPQERGTAEGAMHMAFDLTMGVAALGAGFLISATGGFEVPFAFAAVVMVGAAALFFALFQGAEAGPVRWQAAGAESGEGRRSGRLSDGGDGRPRPER